MKRTPAQALGTARQEIGGAPVVDSDTPGAVHFGDKWYQPIPSDGSHLTYTTPKCLIMYT